MISVEKQANNSIQVFDELVLEIDSESFNDVNIVNNIHKYGPVHGVM